MNNKGINHYKIRPKIFIFLFCLLCSMIYSNMINAQNMQQLPGSQLAFFIGYHHYDEGYYRPVTIHYRSGHTMKGFYWTAWRNSGHGCSTTCLVDKWSGTAISCKQRCRE